MHSNLTRAKCGAMEKIYYLAHCKNIIQYLVFKKILKSKFYIITNSKLLKLFLKLKKIHFYDIDLFFNNSGYSKINNFYYKKISKKNFIEAYNFSFKSSKLIKLENYLNYLISNKNLHVIFFNQYHFINQIIKNICEDKKIPYSEVEINNFTESFKISSGKKINISYFNYNLVKNKFFKALNFLIDDVLLGSNGIFFKNNRLKKFLFFFNSFLSYAFIKIIMFAKSFFKKTKNFDKIYLLQCSHDSSILCKAGLSIDEYLQEYLFKAKENDLVVIHPEERSLKIIFIILKHCFRNKVGFDFSIKTLLKYHNYERNHDQFRTLSSTSLIKLINV